MKPIIVVDVETGGLNPETDALLGIGAVELVVVDGVWQKGRMFEVAVEPVPGLRLDQEALVVNGWPWPDMERVDEAAAALWFADFLRLCGVNHRWVMGGYNTHFDRRFLLAMEVRACGALDRAVVFPLPGHRLLDAHSLGLADVMLARAHGEKVPEALYGDALSEWLGIDREAKPHRPLAGAVWAADAILACIG